MAELKILGQQLASRRAMLLGMTLAEVMLIVLFCLLLLLGSYYRKLQEQQLVLNTLGPINDAPWARDASTTEVETLGELIAEMQAHELPGESREDVWTRLTDNLEKMRQEGQLDPERDALMSRLREATERAAEAESRAVAALEAAEDARETAANLETAIENSQQRSEALEREIQSIKAGSPPPCLFHPASQPGALRGESIQLGAVRIENGSLTLVDRTENIESLNPVDFLGNPAQYGDALNLLGQWPIDRALNSTEYEMQTAEFLRIGDDESNGKLRCRFTMNYVIDDGVPISMLVDEFERNFYKGVRLGK